MNANGILVLECPWSDNLSDATSVRPFIEGWATVRQLPFSYRMYYDANSLAHWLNVFAKDKALGACYVAGHGNGGRLSGLTRDINLASLGKATGRNSKSSIRKGVLFGSCDVGSNLDSFLSGCSNRISWVAGYDRTVPWMESMMCDLLFLEYVLTGRPRRKDGAFSLTPSGSFRYQTATSISMARSWLLEDCGLAALCGFVAHER